MYDITNGWSFDGIDRWIREIDEVISAYSEKMYAQELAVIHVTCLLVVYTLS